MKTAKEMFEELGYEQTKNHYSIEYYKEKIEWGWKRVYFWIDEKTFYADENYESMNIDVQTYKAIHQQMKELGWLDE